MNFSLDAILAATPKAAAKLLKEAGDELIGKNLRKSSWQEIAEAIQRQNNLADIAIQRLRAARTRDDVLRVLRIVRKAAQKQHRRRVGQARVVKAPTTASPRQPERQDAWEELFPSSYFYEFWESPTVYDGYFREWQAEHQATFAPADLLLPGVWPVSPLQAQVVDYVLARKITAPTAVLTLRQRLAEADLRRLQTAVSTEPHLDIARFTAEDRAFFERYGLSRLLHCLDTGELTSDPPVTDGYELAGLTRFDDHSLEPAP